jgi:hypothetical protein
MLAFGVVVNSAPDDSAALVDHDGPDAGIGRGKPHTLASQFEGLRHEEFVCRAPYHGRLPWVR